MTASIVNTTKWTVDDYHRMIEAGILSDRQVELLSGVIVGMSPEGIDQADLSDEAAQYLRGLLGDRGDSIGQWLTRNCLTVALWL